MASTADHPYRSSRRAAGAVAFVAAVAVALLAAQVARGGSRQGPPAGSGIAQYVEELPAAGGTIDVDSRLRPLPGSVTPRVRRAISQAGGTDATTLTRLAQTATPAPAVQRPQTKPPQTKPPRTKPARSKPGTARARARRRTEVEHAQQQALQKPDQAAISSAALSGAFDGVGSDAGNRVLALLVGLAALTALAAAVRWRGRSRG